MGAANPTNPSPDRAFLLAVGLMVLGAALTAVDTLLVRVLSQELNAFSIAFFRSIFGLIFVLPWIYKRRSQIFRTNFAWLHAVRAALKVLALVTFFYAVSRANLAQVTAINFATPIFVMIGALLFLGEKLGLLRIVAVVLGFGGVLLIVRPATGQFDPFLLFALLGALFTAAIQLVLKAMSRRDPTDTLVAWNLILMGPLALIPAVFFWTTPSPAMLGLLALQGALGAIGMTAITRAMSLADVSAIIPFDFLRLPLVALGASYFFSQSADAVTWMGAAIIFSAGLVASRRPATPVTSTVPVQAAADVTEIDYVADADTKTTDDKEPKP